MTSAVAREVTWLTATGDGLPSLLAADGGPWGVVQSYWARTPADRVSGIYLLRVARTETRWAAQRKRITHNFRGLLRWPIGSTTTGTGIWETEQAAFDDAIELLTERIRGFVGNHTHGGQFLSVAEAPDPATITVRFDPPEQTLILSPAMLTAEITYSADDQDITG